MNHPFEALFILKGIKVETGKEVGGLLKGGIGLDGLE